MSATLQKVKVVCDSDSHWYVIPNDRIDEFYSDDENEEMADSGEFGDKWDEFRTGGDINLVQLYAEI